MDNSEKILNLIDTLIEATFELNNCLLNNMYSHFECILNDVIKSLMSIKKSNTIHIKQIELIILSLIDSSKRIKKLFYLRSTKTNEKIEFELKPLLEELKLIYYRKYIESNNKLVKKYYEEDIYSLSANHYIDESEIRGKYKYVLSVCILAYNNLQYTKLCVDSVVKNIPKNIEYEIILINHGSTDGTKEYFDSVSPTKQLDIKFNGGGQLSAYRIIEGKYVLWISNDVIVTKNSIINMLQCIQSDNKIARVVPTTPNVSNFQTVYGEYSNLDEMFEFSYKNNKTDMYRWEQRSRLCDPISMIRSSIVYSSKGIGIGRWRKTENVFSFPDDEISLLLRRNGYKNILAKDAYCYHFGSVTLKDEIKKQNEENNEQIDFYTQGRIDFYNTFGIDPWGTGFCWDPNLFQHLKCNEKEHVDVLGINCGIGSNPLKVKESIKEIAHNLDVTTYNVTDQEEYILDLNGVSDIAECVESCENIDNIFVDKRFKYIIFEDKFETYGNPIKMINNLMKRLSENGIIAVKVNEELMINELKRNYCNLIQSGDWIIIR